MPPRTDDALDATVLRQVLAGTVAHTGPAFFRALVRNLASVMDTAGAWVTEYLPETRTLRAHAFWLQGDFVDGYSQAIDGTPCEVIIEDRKPVHIPDRLGELYPENALIRSLGVQSYLGVPLLEVDGSVMGHLAVLDLKPLPRNEPRLALFEIFAARAAAEQRRLRHESELRAREEELTALLDGTMDAVLVLDEEGIIHRANPAAERIFHEPLEQLRGRAFRAFLAPSEAALFAACQQELDGAGDDRRHLWIPRTFAVSRRDGSTFCAEATLSRFVNRGQTAHTIILRDVDERLAAERQAAILRAETDGLGGGTHPAGLGDIIGASSVMRALFESLQRVAGTDATVLVTGETGTGKELIAQSIHLASKRAAGPLVRVNCAAMPGTLIESELFGHERGAFTGATSRREGRFSLADRGTIFLDEVGEIPLDLQAKLLRVLQEGEFEPLGGTRSKRVDVRVVAATNRDLHAMVAAGTFREDLFYRLNVFPVSVPPLRERGEDIARLAHAFVARAARRLGRPVLPLAPEDLARLQAYPWPGNVRELQNVIERALILATGNRVALERALPVALPSVGTNGAIPPGRVLTAAEFRELERGNLTRALEQSDGKVAGPGGAAEKLGLPPSTVTSRLKALGLLAPRAARR